MLVSLVLFNIADLSDLVCLCEWFFFFFFYYDDLFYFIRISNTLHIYVWIVTNGDLFSTWPFFY